MRIHIGIIYCQHSINIGYQRTVLRHSPMLYFKKLGALQNCLGFVDGTVRPVFRPSRNQQVLYNAHKNVHALKFQSVAVPTGLVANLNGPVEGKRHHSAMLAESGLYNRPTLILTGLGLAAFLKQARPFRGLAELVAAIIWKFDLESVYPVNYDFNFWNKDIYKSYLFKAIFHTVRISTQTRYKRINRSTKRSAAETRSVSEIWPYQLYKTSWICVSRMRSSISWPHLLLISSVVNSLLARLWNHALQAATTYNFQ